MNIHLLYYIIILTILLLPSENMANENSLIPLIEELEMLTGSHANICGIVFLNDDIERAWSCITEVEKTNAPYWIAIERQSIDSDVWIAGLRTPSGKTYILEYDSNYRGRAGLLPNFSRKQCPSNLALTTRAPTIIQCLWRGLHNRN